MLYLHKLFLFLRQNRPSKLRWRDPRVPLSFRACRKPACHDAAIVGRIKGAGLPEVDIPWLANPQFQRINTGRGYKPVSDIVISCPDASCMYGLVSGPNYHLVYEWPFMS